MFLWGDWTFLLLIPALILSGYAQVKVNSAYTTYSKVPTRNGMDGQRAARIIMDDSGIPSLRSVDIVQINGKLTDNYNPTTKIMSLSRDVMYGQNIAAVGVAAHETGHALQDAQNYAPMRFRNFIVPISGFASSMSWPLFLVGLVFAGNGGGSSFGMTLMNIGILLYCVALLFYVITLPVEINASKRAMAALRQDQILNEEELIGVKKVLSAAALTYIASMLTALLTLLRLVILRNSRRN